MSSGPSEVQDCGEGKFGEIQTEIPQLDPLSWVLWSKPIRKQVRHSTQAQLDSWVWIELIAKKFYKSEDLTWKFGFLTSLEKQKSFRHQLELSFRHPLRAMSSPVLLPCTQPVPLFFMTCLSPWISVCNAWAGITLDSW